MRILLITDKVPYPTVSGTLLRMYHICKGLGQRHELWLATPTIGEQDAMGIAHMRQFCHEIITAPRERYSRVTYLSAMARHATLGKPLEYVFEHCEALFQHIRKLTAEIDFDIIQLDPSYMGLYVEAIAPTNPAKRLLMFHNIESNLFSEIARVEKQPITRFRTWLHSRMLRHWEATYTKRFDHCITVSAEDRRMLLTINPRLPITVSPNGVDATALQPFPQQATSPSLLFVGSMDYQPNDDAIHFFVGEILPQIRRAVPDVALWIVGRAPSPAVQQMDGGLIHVTGSVPDVGIYYQQCMLSVVPLRAGGGTRLKILESMALGRPVVSTSKGCEGLAVEHGEHLLIADSATTFAEQSVRLLTDAALRQRLIQNGRELVVKHYDWQMIVDDLIDLYVEIVDDQRQLHFADAWSVGI